MTSTTADLAERIRSALEGGDLEQIGALLHPDAHWGPPGGASGECTNRRQVLAYWGASKGAGTRASVTEVVIEGDKVLVGLRVTGRQDPSGRGDDPFDRWQVLILRDGLVCDIRGYDHRADAAEAAGLQPASPGA